MQMQASNTHVVVGLGKTGLSCARYLRRRNVPFVAVDTRAEPPGIAEFRHEFPDVRTECGELNADTLCSADTLVMSPGVDLRTPAVRMAISRGVKITGDIDLFAKAVDAPLVAITGSNAKSTVVTLVGEMAKEAGLRTAVAGNIGTPVLDLLNDEPYEIYVLELSSFQLETTTNLNAAVATVLNMSPDHMDRYDSMQAYHRAKHRIFQGARHVVVNRDDALTRPLLPATVKVSSFGVGPEDSRDFAVIEHDGAPHLAYERRPLLAVSELKIFGRHNVANALAALALGRAAGLAWEPMLETLRRFPGLPHRCQWVATVNGVPWYNDSKGTNVGASVAAIVGLGSTGRVVLLAGGVGKGQKFDELAPVMKRHGKLAILFGEDAEAIALGLRGAVPVLRAESLQDAVAQAQAQAGTGDLVLLSPACASFDMFDNYEHRGRAFIEAVEALH
ncbi:MAG: UDP-N-acetylmuramoyl-L-alanine--D-glutamate ligase [Pseudomonadota bacterium]|nr:UDP-N-acetylmuramoyl-L-alanine--D-glutamate ligase [Pseudomonadota bacterium]